MCGISHPHVKFQIQFQNCQIAVYFCSPFKLTWCYLLWEIRLQLGSCYRWPIPRSMWSPLSTTLHFNTLLYLILGNYNPDRGFKVTYRMETSRGRSFIKSFRYYKVKWNIISIDWITSWRICYGLYRTFDF